MSITDNLNSVFGIETEEQTKEIVDVSKELRSELVSVHKNHDMNFARSVLVELLGKSTDLLDESIVLAKESQSPRAFEVSSNLIKTISDVAQDLISIHVEKGRGGSKTSPVESTDNTNATQNNIYIGTTSDLSKMLKEASEKEVIEG